MKKFERKEMKILFRKDIALNDKVNVTYVVHDGIMECTGYVTKIDDDAYWLNEIRFPKAFCSFELLS